MSKLLRLLPLLLIVSFVFGGGMVENTNQSAEFVRMMARGASTDLDAVFFTLFCSCFRGFFTLRGFFCPFTNSTNVIKKIQFIFENQDSAQGNRR